VTVITTSRLTDRTLRTMQYCIALTVLYILLIFVLPANHATMHHYHLSIVEYKVATAALATPAIAVWFAAFWGYAKLREYSQSIAKSKEGPYFDRLGIGCAWLAWSLPVTTISSLLLSGIANRWSGFHPTAIIATNYLALIVPFFAFIIIASAARSMIGKFRIDLGLMSARLAMTLFLAGGIAYCFLIFHRLDSTNLSSTNNSYFLPAWLLIVSVIVPYLYAWFIGLLAAYEISRFSLNIGGLLYRKALIYMVTGLVAVILASIALQYIDSAIPRTGELVFNYKLLLTLVAKIISGIGFFILALGASRLKKIEEV
jgi:hypothetical protein